MKNQLKKILLGISVFFAFAGMTLPDQNTAIFGNDVRTTSTSSLYALNVSAPESAQAGTVFEVRLSLEHAEALPLQSSAQAIVTGGDLTNQQVQKLSPDAVWTVRAGAVGTVGVILRVSTDYLREDGKPEATYKDTLTQRIAVTATEAKKQNAGVGTTSTNSFSPIFWGGFAAAGILLVVMVAWAVREIRK